MKLSEFETDGRLKNISKHVKAVILPRLYDKFRKTTFGSIINSLNFTSLNYIVNYLPECNGSIFFTETYLVDYFLRMVFGKRSPMNQKPYKISKDQIFNKRDDMFVPVREGRVVLAIIQKLIEGAIIKKWESEFDFQIFKNLPNLVKLKFKP